MAERTSVYVYKSAPDSADSDEAVSIKEVVDQEVSTRSSKVSESVRQSYSSGRRSTSRAKLVEFFSPDDIPNANVDMSKYVTTPNDSTDPSYTKLTLPYSVICRQRYRAAGARQKAQFSKEIRSHELLQSKALDGVRIHREFCNAILHQPKAEEMIKLTRKQQAQIEQILSRPDE